MSQDALPATEGTVLPADLVARVTAWVAEDPDPGARAELRALLAQGDEAGLRDRFDHPLAFGTAGLRGPLGAGPARVNQAVVRRTTAGLVSYLRQRGQGTGAGVVVGHDARHRSAELAGDAARVVAAGGLRAWHFRSALPTPVTAFAVRHLEAAAGVVVTASHNPAPDNGYKVYLSDGALVFPPHDAAIAAAASRTAMPLGPTFEGPFGDRLVDIDEAEVLAAYRRAVLAVVSSAGPRRLRVVYTPVHGVGGAVLPGLLEEAGFDRPALVEAQAAPDPDFPTAPFPNPEEPGVLDLALAEAGRLGADLLLANDPDADRLAVAVPDRRRAGFRVLSGDELGVLVADHLISTTTGADRLVATTVVSSSMLSALAARTGVAYVETLTGFKWIARAAQRRPGHRLLFGYEEALGYAVTSAVADKDGLSAALVVADMAARAQDQGRSLLDRLDELECLLGVHATGQWSVRLPGSGAPDVLTALMARLRAAPPGRLAGLEVTGVRDLAQGDGELPPSDVLVLQLGGGAGRVVLRPSGTEPKLKAYLEATTGPGALEDLGEARRAASARLDELRHEVADLVSGGA
ncbi:MAG: phospho-sugar mutase [Acidimicrobiales bacterium]